MLRFRLLPALAGLAATSRCHFGMARYPQSRRRLMMVAFVGTAAVTTSTGLLWKRAHAEASSSVNHDMHTTAEKMRSREVVNEGSDDRKVIESDNVPQAEGKKKKQRSGFRDRKVCLYETLLLFSR
ncbi:calcium uptake protein 1, mitochondrial-like [Python bivittatus]|uniref:Calcium uptake protein 1, mitochondrial-like n=1 Tax=Python bivittatus TaxID=176946 RepID=A0A9F5IJI1_PYTBI|nr:calcium uptake protein 1, mitochondrial-like [Python bivittatus]